MIPINDLEGIEKTEKELKYNHIILFLLIKESDVNADTIIRQFHYYDIRSGSKCIIYPIGYTSTHENKYGDTVSVNVGGNRVWGYSDTAFSKTCKQLKLRIKKWNYVGEPELIILQNKLEGNNNSLLDFRNYCYIDINYAINQGYIDSFQRFMERLLDACEEEINARDALINANKHRFNYRELIAKGIEATPRLPKPIKKIMKDIAFFKTYNNY